jgi:membrane protein implicated in regulation of membrane protease activity
MPRRKIDWGWGGCVFLAAAVILSAMILVMGGIVSRSGKFTAASPVFALVIFLVFGFIGIVFLAIWFFSRRKKQAEERKAKWRGHVQKPPPN